MSRETDKRIAEWLGYKWHSEKKSSMHDPYWSAPDGKARGLPVFSTSDSAAITLLPVLVERGWKWKIESVTRGIYVWAHNGDVMIESVESTIASAITSAITALIEREETK